MEINGKVVDALQMYTDLMKELPMYGYGGMPPKMGSNTMTQTFVQSGMPPPPQVCMLCRFWVPASMAATLQGLVPTKH